LFVQRHGEYRVGLVVPVADVEPGVELLDPVVLQLERLDLGGHHGPLDGGRGGHHLSGARVQPGEGGEVRGQAAAQALGLAEVDPPPVRVAELVHAGCLGNGAWRWTIGRRVGHPTSLRPCSDTLSDGRATVWTTGLTGRSPDGSLAGWTYRR